MSTKTQSALPSAYVLGGAKLLIGFIVAVSVLAFSGADVMGALMSLVVGSVGPRSIQDSINWAVPLVGMTLVAAIPLRAGIINLGGDGQLVVGALTSALVAIYLPLPGPILTLVAMIAGAASAGLFAVIAGYGETKFKIPLIISSLLLSYCAIGLASYLVSFPFNDMGSGSPQTVQVPIDARLPLIGGSVNAGAIVILAVCILVVFVDRRSVAGFETQVSGNNRDFAAYVGIDTKLQTLKLMFAAGAVAGLVGSIMTLGSFYRFIDGALISPGYTWSGLMAALIGRGEPVACILAGAFFAALQTGGFAMQRSTSVPRVFTTMLQAVIVLILTVRFHKQEGRHD